MRPHTTESKPRKEPRFIELDFARGIAVVAMVIFNWLFALDYLGVRSTNVTSGFWFYFARITAAAFILIAGISLNLSVSGGKSFREIFRRGLTIFFFGMIITLVTWIFLKGAYVRFGILHLIGASIILAYPLAKLRYPDLLAGVIAIAAGLYLQAFSFGFSWLLWLGFAPQNFYSVDYFPLLPWFGVFLTGIFAGNSLYAHHTRNFSLKFPDTKITRTFSFLGRNSLLIYLIHQPVLVAALYLMGAHLIF